MSDYQSLVQVAKDSAQSSYRRRQAVSEILKSFASEKQTLTLLKEILSEDDTTFKRDVVGALKNNAFPDLLPIVRPLLNENDDYLKRDVIELLGKSGSADDLPLIEPLCSDSSFSVSYAAKQAMQKLEQLVETEEVAKSADEPEEEITVEDIQPIDDKEPAEEEKDELAEEDNSESEPPAKEESKEKESDSRKEVKEIHPHKQKLPDSLHDNSIFGEKSITEASTEHYESLQGHYSKSAPGLSSGMNPQESENLKIFFGKHYQPALALYKQLKNSESELPGKEIALSECTHRLALLEADKADDLMKSQASVAEQSKSQKEQQWQVKKAQQAIINLEKEHKELINKILFMFSSDKKEQAEKQKDKLQQELKKAKEQLESETGEFENLNAEAESIKETLVALRSEFEHLKSDRDTVLDKIFMTEKEINKLIVEILAEGSDAGERLSFLKDQAIAPGIVNRIVSLTNRLNREEAKRDSLRSQLETLQYEAIGHTDCLGAEISRSLTVKSSTKKETVDIRASLQFREDESFFSFSNASGSASGTGSATASVDVDEIAWNESGGLQSAVKDFSGSFGELGKVSTELEISELKVQTADAALAHYVDYVRCYLESDFGE